MQVRVFDTVTGAPAEGANVVPFTDVSWSLKYNEAGGSSLSLKPSLQAARWGMRRKLRPWRYCVAVVEDDGTVRTAGPITRRKWTLGSGLSVTVGDGWDLTKIRLVLNHELEAKWRDGSVVIDEDNPAAEWQLVFSGVSLGGVGQGLVREALKWGDLLIDDPGDVEAGTHTRTYNGWDFATTYDRLQDLAGVEGAPLMRFTPYIRSDGYLRFRFEGNVVGEYRRLSANMPGHGIILTDVDEDGSSMATESYALGGREDDIVLVSRTRSSVLTEAGWPVMMSADKTHSSVSVLKTLKGYTNQAVVDGATLPESTQFKARRSLNLLPGDLVDLSAWTSFHGDVEMPYRLVSVSGDTSEWCTVSAFPDGQGDI